MEAIERNFFSKDWITLIFLFCFLLLFLMKLYRPKRLLSYFVAFYTQGIIEKRSEEKKAFFSPFYGILFLFSVIVISTGLYFLFNKSYNFSYIHILLGVILYFVILYTISFSVVSILGIQYEVRYFLYTKLGYFYNLSLWLFPILIIYQYGIKNWFLLAFFAILLLCFRFFLIFNNNKKLIFNQLFYFILYFCTLELAPLLILYKTTTT